MIFIVSNNVSNPLNNDKVIRGHNIIPVPAEALSAPQQVFSALLEMSFGMKLFQSCVEISSRTPRGRQGIDEFTQLELI